MQGQCFHCGKKRKLGGGRLSISLDSLQVQQEQKEQQVQQEQQLAVPVDPPEAVTQKRRLRRDSPHHAAGAAAAGAAAGGIRCSSVALSSYQRAAAQRIASSCRAQFGHLVYHRMGAGKTLTALTVLFNMDQRVGRTVFCPRSILRDTFHVDSKDAAKLFPDAADRAAFFSSLAVAALEDVPRLHSKGELAGLVAGRVVLVDEAHNLFPALRTPGTGPQLLRILHTAARLILMTGTPILSGVGDMGLMLQLVGKYSSAVMPSQPQAFKQLFYSVDMSSWRGVLRSARGWTTPLLTSALSSVLFAANLAVPIASVQAAVAGMDWRALLRWSSADTSGVAVKLVAGMLGTMMWTSMVQSLNKAEFRTLDAQKFLPKATPLISFFDYEQAEEAEEEVLDGKAYRAPPRMYFPRKRILTKDSAVGGGVTTEDVPYIGMSPFQMRLLLEFCDNKLSPENARILGLLQQGGEEEEEGSVFFSGTDAASPDTALGSTFTEWAGAIGNLSEDAVRYKTRWNGGVPGGNVLRQSFEAVEMSKDSGDAGAAAPGAAATGAKAPGAAAAAVLPFGSAKFDWVLRRLLRLRATPALSPCWLVDPATGRFVRNAAGAKQADDAHWYLPVVYSTYEEAGFRAFSAYLHARGHEHVVYLGGALDLTRKTAIDAAAMTTRYPRAAASGPLCVLLHPSIKEGVSFTHNPELIVLEPIRGFGVQEQVYGRVLRRYAGPPEATDQDRPVKSIVQLSMGIQTRALLSYYHQAAEHYVRHQSLILPLPSILAYMGTHMDTAPDDTVLQQNAESGAVADALAKAFRGRADAGQCAPLPGPPPCTMCLRGVCGCPSAGHACPSASLDVQPASSYTTLPVARRGKRDVYHPTHAPT
jgi:hypothetical protein